MRSEHHGNPNICLKFYATQQQSKTSMRKLGYPSTAILWQYILSTEISAARGSISCLRRYLLLVAVHPEYPEIIQPLLLIPSQGPNCHWPLGERFLCNGYLLFKSAFLDAFKLITESDSLSIFLPLDSVSPSKLTDCLHTNM